MLADKTLMQDADLISAILAEVEARGASISPVFYQDALFLHGCKIIGLLDLSNCTIDRDY